MAFKPSAKAIAPSDPMTIYVGTGESSIRSNVSIGDGVYKSEDGGETWKHLGLKNTDHLNRLIIKLYVLILKLNLKSKLSKLSDRGFLDFNDHFIKINSDNVTTDKLVSLLDYKKIEKNLNLSRVKRVLEIGAGSGRFSQTFLTFKQNSKYIICDIPPAIYISYYRLKKVFKQKRIRLCFNCNNSESLEKLINENDILFIFPHQIKFLHESNIDLVIAIDCIHEMDKKTIRYYFENVDKFAKQLYFSVWKSTSVPYSSPFKYLTVRAPASISSGPTKTATRAPL